jgi:YVTN family beta-propeller protein
LYVANNNGGRDANGSVSIIDVIDIGSQIVIDVISLSPAMSPIGMAVSGTTLYVANNSSSGSVSVIDTTNNTVITTIMDASLIYPGDIAINGSLAYVTNNGSHTISVIDLNSNTVINSFSVSANMSSEPEGIAILGSTAYVANFGDPSLVAVDLLHETYTTFSDPGSTLNGPSYIAFPISSSSPRAFRRPSNRR